MDRWINLGAYFTDEDIYFVYLFGDFVSVCVHSSLHAVYLTIYVCGQVPLTLVQIKFGIKGPVGNLRQAFAYNSLAILTLRFYA